jgi:hypothetical protein
MTLAVQEDGTTPVPVLDVQEGWLGMLRLAWAGKYIIALDEDADPAWMVWRTGDDSAMLTARTPAELNAAIRADRPRGEIR